LTTTFSRVGVAVPARDEEATISACVSSILAASRRLELPVDIVVVCDSCTDATAVRAQSAGARTLTIKKRNVGAARAAGLADLVSNYGSAGLWLATTDADSVVPPEWLARMVSAGRTGSAAVVGTVHIEDWRAHTPRMIEAFARHYARGIGRDGHIHVHGANLGFSALAYQQIGGLAPLALAEDHALIDAFVARGLSVARLTDLVVTTSARLDGRASGGFADLLRSLVLDNPLPSDTSPA
jgi:glycosyltransferase involved in cell wall biosynthesis